VFPDALAPSAIPALLAAAEGSLTAFYDGTVAGLVELMDREDVSVSVTSRSRRGPTK